MPRRKVTTTSPGADRSGASKQPSETAGFVHRVVPAAGSTPPATTAAPSVFSAAKPKRRSPTITDPIDPRAVVVRKGVPIPPHQRSHGAGTYSALMERMTKGDMVELPHTKAKSLYSWATANGIKASTRRLTDDTSGVWRLS